MLVVFNFCRLFFDGFIADWLVQSKINDAQRQVNEAISMLNNIKEQLLSI